MPPDEAKVISATLTVERLEAALQLARKNYGGVVQVATTVPGKACSLHARSFGVGGWSDWDNINRDGGPHGQRNIGTA